MKEIELGAFYLLPMPKCNIKERRVRVALLVVDNTSTTSQNPALAIDTPLSLLTKMNRPSYIPVEHSNNSL
jgi:hypothetical protein